MGGKSSRDKGMRVEREVRDYFRARGWESSRVPLSGASESGEDKGDVRLAKDGVNLVAEVKARRDEFKSIYGLLDSHPTKIVRLSHSMTMVTASYDFADLHFTSYMGLTTLFDGVLAPTRTQKKLLGLIKHVKTCDFLVLKCNNRPFIFVRYWGVR